MHKKYLDRIISQALKEDIGRGDVTTELLIPASQISKGYILLKENATLCGIDIARRVFRKLDPALQFQSTYKDGDTVSGLTKIIDLKGKTRAILSAERVALNFLSYLSSIATKTRAFVRAVSSCDVTILDTRKTTPGLRWLEKMAVGCGGGENHRSSLEEMVFIKDNHWKAILKKFSIKETILYVRKHSKKKIIAEAQNLKEFEELWAARPDVILLDNMSVDQMRRAVSLNRARGRKGQKKVLLEASGGIRFENVRAVAKIGVDRISVGELTHSRREIDFSLEII